MRSRMIFAVVFSLAACAEENLQDIDAADAGTAIPDAPDASTPTTDASVTIPLEPPDAGTLDAAVSVADAAVSVADAAVTAPDAAVTETPLDGNHARIVSGTLPPTVLTGAEFNVPLVIKNTGTTTWTETQGYWLGNPDDVDDFTLARIALPQDPVMPGQTVTFLLTMRAPLGHGTYPTRWRMVQEQVEWFGDSTSQDIVVEMGVCDPMPPQLHELRGNVHNNMGWRKILDSTPIVYGQEYCASIGFTDGRRFCPPRPEGHPQTDTCNTVVMGLASDTGRVGPTWTFNGLPCIDEPTDGRCRNHSDNQFHVITYGSGLARACVEMAGICKEIEVPE